MISKRNSHQHISSLDSKCSLYVSILCHSVPPVDFLVKIQEVKAEEREDAIFECVTSLPMNQILWTLKNNPLSNSDKYEITVSEDKMIHRLKVIDCMPVDAGIYCAVAGIKSCSAWLVVEGRFQSTMY